MDLDSSGIRGGRMPGQVERPGGDVQPLCGEGQPGLTTHWTAGLQVRAPPSSGDVLDEVSLEAQRQGDIALKCRGSVS